MYSYMTTRGNEKGGNRMSAYEATAPIVFVFADSADGLDSIAPDLVSIKIAVITTSGEHYVLPPNGTWQKINH